MLMGQKQIDRQTGGLGDHTPGGVGAADGMLGQDPTICSTKLYHQVLLFGMAHNGDVHGINTSLVCMIATVGRYLSNTHNRHPLALQPAGDIPAG